MPGVLHELFHNNVAVTTTTIIYVLTMKDHFGSSNDCFYKQLGDFGLAKWKTSDDPVYTLILGTLG